MIPFRQTLEAFLDSGHDFETAVMDSTHAGFGGSGYSVELFEDGTWRVLWDSMIGNLYYSPGLILSIPQHTQDTLNDLDTFGDDCDLSFALEEIKDEMRDDIDMRLNGYRYAIESEGDRVTMGYTHYWETTPAYQGECLDRNLFHAFIQDVIAIIAASTKWNSKKLNTSYEGYLSLYDVTDFFIGLGDKGELVVMVNGKYPYDHETACFSQTPSAYEFCKTERFYDDIVCVLLLSYAHHFQGLVTVTSDGDSDDWEQAATWYQDIFDRPLPSDTPWRKKKTP